MEPGTKKLLHIMGIKNPTQLVSPAKTFMLVSGIVVEFHRDRRLTKLLSSQRNSLTFKIFL
jgi:hypothetical protein